MSYLAIKAIRLKLCVMFAMLVLGAVSWAQPAPALSELLAQADKFRAEGSFRQARELYEQIQKADPAPPSEVLIPAQVFAADCLWRERGENEQIEQATKTLRRLVEDLSQLSLWQAEAAESLGDLQSERTGWEHPEEIYSHWLLALKYWSQATDTATARPRYLALNFKIAERLINYRGIVPFPDTPQVRALDLIPPPPPPDRPWEGDLASWCLRKILYVSKEPTERAHAQYLLGLERSRNRNNDPAWDKEAEQYLKQAAEAQPVNEWTDDSLWELGQYYETRERYTDAVAAYRAFFDRYKKGESPLWDQVEDRHRTLTRPFAQFSGGPAFAPDSYIHLTLNYRNLGQASLHLRRIKSETLVQSLRAEPGRHDENNLKTMTGETVYEEPIPEVTDSNDLVPHTQELYLKPLPPGFYQVWLQSPSIERSEEPLSLIYVSRLAVAVKPSSTATLHAFAADAETGQPQANARVWVVAWDHSDHSATAEAASGPDGQCQIPWTAPFDTIMGFPFWVIAERDGHVALFRSYHSRAEADQAQPVLYAYADRPAYRPGDPIAWKAIMRLSDGKTYRLPEERAVYVTLRDERAGVVWEGPMTLNEYGTMHGTATASRSAALGMINLEVQQSKGGSWLGSAPLARLEEYKLPEYKVTVTPGPGQHRMGDAVPFSIDAQYYFGGPVAGAKVHVVVYRRPFWPRWFPPTPYPWLYQEDFGGGRYFKSPGSMMWPRWDPEQIVLEQDLETDSQGKASVQIGALTAEQIKEAADRKLWGYAYRVQARVVDTSRREVSADGEIKVARTAFAAYLNPQRYLSLPGDPVKVDLRTLDPNDKPVAADGLMTVYRRQWIEVPPQSSSIIPTTINQAVALLPLSTPAPSPQAGYRDDKLFSRVLTTGPQGQSVFDFQPSEPGTYLIKFETKDAFGEPVSGETLVFVATRDTTQIGYRAGGVEIITDKETYQRGEIAHILLAVRRPGASVWLGIEGDALHAAQVVPIEGSVKMVDIPITEDFEPNIYLTALSMFDYSAFSDSKRLVIPPARRYLDVKILAPKEEYRPGEEATLTVEVHDSEGKPVQTELSLGVADASVWAIQGELAADIRQAFWGRLRPLAIRTEASSAHAVTEFWRPKPGGKSGEYERVTREEIPSDETLNVQSASGPMMDDSGRGVALGEVKFAGVSTKRAKEMSMAVPAGSAPMAQSGADQSFAPARLRTDFRATALWLADAVTGPDGRATATVTFPDSLTAWRMTARAADSATRVGQAAREAQTNKPIMVRPQGPRYFIQGDEATLSAVVNNNTSDTQRVQVGLGLKGLRLAPVEIDVKGEPWLEESTEPVQATGETMTIVVPAGAERRVDWTAVADAPGSATITMSALTPIDSDAAEKIYPVHEYGIEQFIAASTAIRGPEPMLTQTLTLDLPRDRRAGSESLTVWIEPTLASTMVNALDYLADYPYGCIEQTLSRFVPAVITAQTLKQLGLSRPELERKLPGMIDAGLTRIYDFQHEDGGWAWWREGDSNPYMTAYVVQGLAQAREAGVSVSSKVLGSAARFLSERLVQFEAEDDMSAFILYALSTVQDLGGKGPLADAAYERLWPNRERLNPYTRALFALACHATGRGEWAAVLVRNMSNGLIEDKEAGTAHWGTSGVYYRWSEGGVEATAFGLRALLAIDPQNRLIDPVTAWLVRNRRAAHWKSTRDTAFVIRALADYITARGEDKPNWTAEIRVNGDVAATLTVTPENVFELQGKIEVPASLLRNGANEVTITRQGSGVLYASAYLTYFTRQEQIKAAGNEVFVKRSYYRIADKPTLSGEYKTERESLKSGDQIASGDRIEVQLELTAKNHLEYLVIEDLKAAGMEPTEVQSGYVWGGGLSAHRELRDEKTAFFLDRLPEGEHTLTYTLRAEVPGVFHALPTLAHAMYVPEIRANSASAVMTLVEQPEKP